MKKTLFICALLFVCSSMFGQTNNDSIIMKKVFSGYQFYQNGKVLNMTQLTSILRTNEEAYKEFQSGKSSYTLATIISCVGGFMTGWQIGTVIAGGEPNWGMAGAGIGLCVVSIPITNKFYNKAKVAVGTYNGGQTTNSIFKDSELKLGFTGNGIGLAMTF